MDNPSVFISYAHEGDMSEQVLALSNFLLANGVQTITDHPYHAKPPEKGWRAWMQHNIEDADVVLVVCTQRYKELFEKRAEITDKGRGVSWESAILTAELYGQYMHNSRIYPILPDGGEHNHIPKALIDWDNGHYFPSGQSRILDLIREEITVPSPSGSFAQLPPAQLKSADDPRLTPREQQTGVIGRSQEISDVLDFLNSDSAGASVCGHVLGSGGIGKTEICKAALKVWLTGNPNQRAFYIDLADDTNAQSLLTQTAEQLGAQGDELLTIDRIDKLRPWLKQGFYYLDNLEGLAESEGGIALLKQLIQLPDLRWLASSRVSLEGILGKSFAVDRLYTEHATELFTETWNGSDLPPPDALTQFCDEQLGGHPLAIVLTARLGKVYPWQTLIERWHEHGTRMATQRKATDRLDSLDISFSITANHLAQTPGALDLWQFAALHPTGMLQGIYHYWLNSTAQDDALHALIDHHLLHLQDNRYTMLPPLARYARENTHIDSPMFDWNCARTDIWATFTNCAAAGSNTTSGTAAITARSLAACQFDSISLLLDVDDKAAQEITEKLRILHNFLHNTYQFSAASARTLLAKTNHILNDGLSSKLFGDLESRLGNIEEARSLYEQAIEHYTNEQAKLGLANALKALGDLESRLGNIEEARSLYEQAIEHYTNEQDQLGLANALKALGDLESRLGNIEEARSLYEQAIEHYTNEQTKLGLANALKALGDLESRLGNIEEARSLYEQAIEHYTNEQAKLGLANALQALGDLESRLGNIEEARSLYEQAIEHYTNEQAKLGLANALKALGDLESRLGNIEEARSLYEQAIEHYTNEQAKLGLANALKALGDLESRLGNIEEARSLYEQAIEHYTNEQDQLGLANALKALGDLESRLGNIEEARSLYEQAIEHYTNEQTKLGLANALKALGDLESRLGNIEEARSLYEQAIEHYTNEQAKLGLANALQALGDLESRLGNIEEARSLYEQAIEHYTNEQAKLGLANALKALGDLESRLGNIEEARSLYEQAIEHYTNEQDQLGLANVFQSQGDLLLATEQWQQAKGIYQRALELYLAEQDPMGAAYTLAELMRANHQLAQSGEFENQLKQALLLAQRSGVDSVVQYVMKAACGVLGEDEEALKALVAKLCNPD